MTIAGFDREATEKETSGAILADALGSTTAAVFNTLPNTVFGQNAGIVAMTKVVNKWCIATGAFILMISGFFPKLGAIFLSDSECRTWRCNHYCFWYDSD
ncbi:MAG: solute carrier family 23 protein [Mediterraneibacter faecis]